MRKPVHKKARKAKKAVSAPALEWLRDAVGGEARATVAAGRRALIENHAGILEYGPELVRLSARNGEIRVQGRELTLSEVRAHSLIVNGRIDAVLLPPEGDGHA